VTVRAAIVGCGAWARMAHVPALRALPEVELVACVGGTAAEGEAFAREQGIPRAYGSLDDLLAARLDLVTIAAPDDVHPPAATAALEAGVAVFCEKPLANEARVAEELAALAERTGVPATVGYSFRFSPALQALRRDLDDGRIGEPWLIELYEHNPQFHPLRGAPLNWKGDPAHAAAGALFEYGSHVVDLAGWLVGPVRSVSACLARIRDDARLDDLATLQLRLERGAVGVLVASWVLAGGFPGIRVRLYGSELAAEAVLDGGRERYLRLADDGSVREEVGLEPLGDAFSAYARRHYAAFLAGDPSVPTLGDGARAQRVLEAALAATESWATVA
jgi:predicted dehydrogenase